VFWGLLVEVPILQLVLQKAFPYPFGIGIHFRYLSPWINNISGRPRSTLVLREIEKRSWEPPTRLPSKAVLILLIQFLDNISLILFLDLILLYHVFILFSQSSSTTQPYRRMLFHRSLFRRNSHYTPAVNGTWVCRRSRKVGRGYLFNLCGSPH